MNEPHPDEILQRTQVKRITRGSRQSADTQAMNAMFDALTEGKTRAEAERIFSDTYLNVLYGKDIIKDR